MSQSKFITKRPTGGPNHPLHSHTHTHTHTHTRTNTHTPNRNRVKQAFFVIAIPIRGGKSRQVRVYEIMENVTAF